MILDTLVMLLVLTAVIGSVAIWASWNEINTNEWIANNVDGCPFKYKWQMADDLSASRLGNGSKMDVLRHRVPQKHSLRQQTKTT